MGTLDRMVAISLLSAACAGTAWAQSVDQASATTVPVYFLREPLDAQREDLGYGPDGDGFHVVTCHAVPQHLDYEPANTDPESWCAEPVVASDPPVELLPLLNLGFGR